MSKVNRRAIGIVVFVLASVIGGGGLLTFMWFLFTGPFNLVDLGLGETLGLLLDACLCLAFFMQHSIMAYNRAVPVSPFVLAVEEALEVTDKELDRLEKQRKLKRRRR